MPGLFYHVEEDVKDLEDFVERTLIAKAIDGALITPSDAPKAVRDLLPYTDLGIGSNNHWTFNLSATGSNTLVNNKDLAGKKMIMIYGFALLSPEPSISTIEFYKGTAKLIDKVQVEGVLAGVGPLSSRGYLKNPIFWDKNDSVTIKAEAWQTNSDERLVFYGKVAEKPGRVIGS
ncbi:hypothetical protein J7L00_04245 [Candidatus Bathyarchaeota archaeon]|nr:hypothetical protein [Candidatus Bathyarchaeota archaeon]